MLKAIIVLFAVVCVSAKEVIHRDCKSRWVAGERKPGVYVIHPNGTHPVKIYCDHNDKGTYTVIQRRQFGTVSFNRGWRDYKLGFGHPSGDYWAGLDVINHLTRSGTAGLQILMQDWVGNNRYANYAYFNVQDEAAYYQMHVNGFQGNVPDDLSYNNGMYFFTPDRPDQYACAKNMRGGWWFYYCTYSYPNGMYYMNGQYNPNPNNFYDGIYWKDWYGFNYSLRFISMSVYHA